MVDGSSHEITVTIGNQEFDIKQSPSLLNSSRSTGTTGAVVWRSTLLLATWFSQPSNCLFKHGLLDSTSTILELGSGVAGLLPLILASRTGLYLATDQSYTIKLLQSNIDNNLRPRGTSSRKGAKASSTAAARASPANVRTAPLDWELDDLKSFLPSHNIAQGVDLVLASDCVYNYHLIPPLVQTCREACAARAANDRPTLCIVAQQLRQPDVLEEWLTAFAEHFAVWRLRDEVMGTELGPGNGYVVHVGVLRELTEARD